MPPRIRLLFSTMLVSLFVMAAVPLYTELSRQSDIWWTPRAMLVPLTGSGERVEIYVRGRSLATLLQLGQVRIAEDSRIECSLLLRLASVSTIGIGSEPSACRCSWRQQRVVQSRPSCSCWWSPAVSPTGARRVGLPNKRM